MLRKFMEKRAEKSPRSKPVLAKIPSGGNVVLTTFQVLDKKFDLIYSSFKNLPRNCPMDTNTLLVFIIALLTTNLLFVGIYIVLVLKEVRSAFVKLNDILDTTQEVVESVSQPVVNASGFVNGLIQGIKIIKSLKKDKEEKS